MSWPAMVALALCVIAAAFWIVARVSDPGERGARTGSTDAAVAARDAASPVQDYLRFAGRVEAGPAQGTGVDAAEIAEGLRRLAGALGARNLGSVDLQINLRIAAEHLLLNPASPATTAVVREALISAAMALDAEPDHGTTLAESISSDRPLLQQQMTIVDFFRAAAQALQQTSAQRSRTHSLFAPWFRDRTPWMTAVALHADYALNARAASV